MNSRVLVKSHLLKTISFSNAKPERPQSTPLRLKTQPINNRLTLFGLIFKMQWEQKSLW